MKGGKRILVPIDFSPLSDQVLAVARRAAVQEGCEVVLLHVIEYADAMRQRPPLVLASVLDRYARLLTDIAPSRVATRVVEGEPVDAILNAARTCECDRIVMGRGGKHGATGHVAEGVRQVYRGELLLVS